MEPSRMEPSRMEPPTVIAVLSRAPTRLSEAVFIWSPIWSPSADAEFSRLVTAADMGASRRAAPASAAIFNASSLPRRREKESPIFLDTAL